MQSIEEVSKNNSRIDQNLKELDYVLNEALADIRKITKLNCNDPLYKFNVEDCDRWGGMSVSFGQKGSGMGLKCYQFRGLALSSLKT